MFLGWGYVVGGGGGSGGGAGWSGVECDFFVVSFAEEEACV